MTEIQYILVKSINKLTELEKHKKMGQQQKRDPLLIA